MSLPFFQKFSLVCIVISRAKYYQLSYIFSRLSISWIHVRSPTNNGQQYVQYDKTPGIVQPSNQKVIKTYVHSSTLLNNIIGDEPRTPTTDGQRNKHSACCNGSNLGTSDESNAGTTATKFHKTKVYFDVVRNKLFVWFFSKDNIVPNNR